MTPNAPNFCDDCARMTAGRCLRHSYSGFSVTDPTPVMTNYLPVLTRIANALERVAAALEATDATEEQGR